MSAPIRVLQVLEATVGGTRQHLVSILQHIDRERFKVEVASPRVRHDNVQDTKFVDQVLALGIPWHEVDMVRSISPRADLAAFVKLAALTRRGRYDLVHLHSSKAGFLGRTAAKLLGVRTIYTPNGFYFLDSDRILKRQFYLRLEQLAGLLTDCLVAVSRSEQEAAIRARLISTSKIRLIPNGIDTLALRPDREAGEHVRRQLGIADDAAIVGTVSRFIAQKDPATFVRAAAEILRQVPNAQFVWCGEGELREEIEQLARTLGIYNAFHFLGFCHHVHDVMNCFDVFVLSSLFEGLPYTLLEVMALGIPVVATRVVGNQDVVSEETGILVPPRSHTAIADAVVQLLHSPNRRRQLGQQGQQMVQQYYDVRVMVRQLEELYLSLAGKRQ